jgi:hypothetical protein
VDWVGEGSELWRVRVDLFAPDPHDHRVPKTFQALQLELRETDGAARLAGDSAVDQGRGIEGRPVIGLVFWVRADDVGKAASLAVETARSAGTESGVGTELYDVVVIPSASVASVYSQISAYPPMPD